MPDSLACAPRKSELLARLVLLDDAVTDVRAIEARDELARGAERKTLDDLAPRRRVGGRGQC